jgi:hypothetical protein
MPGSGSIRHPKAAGHLHRLRCRQHGCATWPISATAPIRINPTALDIGAALLAGHGNHFQYKG